MDTTAMPNYAKQISNILGWPLLDNPKKINKISKVTPPHLSPSRGRRGGE